MKNPGSGTFWLRQRTLSCPSRHFSCPVIDRVSSKKTDELRHCASGRDCARVSMRNPRGVPEQADTPHVLFIRVTIMHRNKEILLNSQDVCLWIFF